MDASRTGGSRQSPVPRFVSHVGYLWDFEKPTIAAINGVAAGAGLSYALYCDIRIAAESARFGAIWVRRGLVADAGATYLLPRIVGLEKSLELMYTGEIIGAREAERIGLVSRVVPDEDLMKEARELALKIAQGPPITIGLTKRAVYREILKELLAEIDFENVANTICHETEDFKEGVRSFLEKRPAQFKGR